MRVSNFKRGGKRTRKPKVLRCPQCGSSDIYYELGLITGYKYHCKDCQYVGALVIEDENLEKGEGKAAGGKAGKGGQENEGGRPYKEKDGAGEQRAPDPEKY